MDNGSPLREACRCSLLSYRDTLVAPYTCKTCISKDANCKHCLDGGGHCYECLPGYEVDILTQKSVYESKEVRHTLTFSDWDLNASEPPTFCKLQCEEGLAWIEPNGCSSCPPGCRHCQEVTLECLDRIIDFTITKKVVSGSKLLEADVFLEVKFTVEDPVRGIIPWSESEGETVSFKEFFIGKTLLPVVVRRRNLEEDFSNLSVVDLNFDKSTLNGETILEIGVIFPFEIATGNYDVSFSAEGGKTWTDNSGTIYHFSDTLKNIVLYNPKKENPAEVQAAEEQGKALSDVGAASSSVAQGVTVAATLAGSGSAMPFIKLLQTLKLYNRLTYIGTDFGKILTGFMNSAGGMSKDQAIDIETVPYYERKWNGKLSSQYVTILVLEKMSWKIALYTISFFLRFLSTAFVKSMRNANTVNKKKCTFIFFQRKAHFMFLNLWILDMAFYSSRTVSQLRHLQGLYPMLNYVVSILVLILLSCDLMHIYFMANELADCLAPYH